MRYILFCAFLIIITLFSICNFAFGDETEYIIITSDRIEGITQEWEKSITMVIGDVRPRRVDVDSPEAQVWIERLGIEFIPYIIFTKGIEQTPKFFELARQGMIEVKNGEYVIPEPMLRPTGVMFFKRESKPLELDLFVMSQCPAGKDAQFQIGNYLEKNPGSFKVACHYITTFRPFGIDSLHGPDEILEDIHQILIQKYYPDKFWEYLKRYHERKDFETSCNELGIDSSGLMLHEKEKEGVAILEADFNLCKELNIDASPTFLWENQTILHSMGAFRQVIPKPVAAPSYGAHAAPLAAQGAATTDVIPILVFYGPSCPHCHWVINEFIPELEREFGGRIAFTFYDTSIQENFERKMKMDEEFAVVGAAVPEIFVAGQVLVGEFEIKDKLRGVIEGLLGNVAAPSYGASASLRAAQGAAATAAQGAATTTLTRFKSFTPFAVAGAGLLDGVNPCAFSTIVFFLSFLTLTGFSLRQSVWVGISFTAAVFLTYLGLGLGAFIGLQRLRANSLF